MVVGCPRRLWVEERSQHLLYSPLCHQSYWCLYHCAALAQLEPQLEDRNRDGVREREREKIKVLFNIKLNTQRLNSCFTCIRI